MENNHQKLVGEAKGRIAQGTSSDEIVKDLQRQGISIIDAIKVIREAYEISLGEAKRLVTSNPAWHKVVEATAPLHDDLEELVINEQKESEGLADNS